MILEKIRKSRITKALSFVMVVLLAISDWQYVFALSDGPKTPEVSGFSSISPAENVDLFSGDFTYTIPLVEIGGYPFNLTYNSNISMEQEASWVGLGWNLSIGTIV